MTRETGRTRAARGRRTWTVAAVQMNSDHHPRRNLERAEGFVRRAAGRGADLVALPENFAYLRTEGTKLGYRVSLEDEPVATLKRLARELGVHVLAGSVPEKIPRSERIYNTSVLIDDRGEIASTYRKVHLFDIAIRGGVELQESKWVRAGGEPVVADTALGKLGLSICYDLRFPELYRKLAFAGARVLFVPAAFTAYTGPHHWLPLLRARAIENLCWVVAPAQTGRHNATRASYGHTVVFDPWGRRVALRKTEPGCVFATIDYDAQDAARQGLPCLDHVRPELWKGGVRRRRAR